MSPAITTLLILAIAVVLFFTERFPLGVTAMLAATALYFTGVYDAATVWKNVVNSNVLMFIGMFIIGGCMFSTGIADKIGQSIARWSKSELQFMCAAYIVTAILSTCLTNVGSVVVLMPVILSTCLAAGYSSSRMIMSTAIAAIMGGNCTLIGTAPPAIAKATLEEFFPGQTFSFFEWSYVGVPMAVVVLIFMVAIGYRLLPDRELSRQMINMTTRDYSKVPRWKGIATVVMLVVCVAFMALETVTGIPLYIVGMTGGILMVAMGICTLDESINMIEWNTILLLAGMLSVASALSTSGAGKLIADLVISLVGGNAGTMVYFFVFAIITTCLTQFMSNTAATSLLAPIGAAVAAELGVSPRGILMVIVMAASFAFLTPVGSPPVTVASGPANYSFKDFPRWGLPLVAICMAVSAVIIPIVWPF